MNRENKLAIIIGFSLVLVVAVLISDHFSRARTIQVGSDVDPGTANDFGAGTAGLTRPIGGQDPIPVHNRPLIEMEHRVQQVSETGGVEPPVADITMGSRLVDTPPPPVTPSEDPQASGAEDPAPSAVVPPKPYSTGEMRFHEVKKGDRLYRIAAKYYNDGTLWKTLHEYNKAKLPDAETLRLGIRLEIPPKDVLLGEAVMPPAGMTPKREPARENSGGRPKGEKPVPPERAIAKSERKDEKAKKPAMTTYKIARGDALSTIAQKLLGTSKRARELFQLNKDVLEDEHTLIAGTVIKIPAR